MLWYGQKNWYCNLSSPTSIKKKLQYCTVNAILKYSNLKKYYLGKTLTLKLGLFIFLKRKLFVIIHFVSTQNKHGSSKNNICYMLIVLRLIEKLNRFWKFWRNFKKYNDHYLLSENEVKSNSIMYGSSGESNCMLSRTAVNQTVCCPVSSQFCPRQRWVELFCQSWKKERHLSYFGLV